MITERYRDVEIVLLEDENKWRFTANGRERTAPSLPKAREYIDNSLDAVKSKKEKVWEAFDAYYKSSNYSTEIHVVKVTSQAETVRSWDRIPDFWISQNGKRHKVNASSLFALNDSNAAVIAELGKLTKEQERIKRQIELTQNRLLPISIPLEEK